LESSGAERTLTLQRPAAAPRSADRRPKCGVTGRAELAEFEQRAGLARTVGYGQGRLGRYRGGARRTPVFAPKVPVRTESPRTRLEQPERASTRRRRALSGAGQLAVVHRSMPQRSAPRTPPVATSWRWCAGRCRGDPRRGPLRLRPAGGGAQVDAAAIRAEDPPSNCPSVALRSANFRLQSNGQSAVSIRGVPGRAAAPDRRDRQRRRHDHRPPGAARRRRSPVDRAPTGNGKGPAGRRGLSTVEQTIRTPKRRRRPAAQRRAGRT